MSETLRRKKNDLCSGRRHFVSRVVSFGAGSLLGGSAIRAQTLKHPVHAPPATATSVEESQARHTLKPHAGRLTRPNVSRLPGGTAQLDQLKSAFQVLINRSKANDSDPTGLTAQGQLHLKYCRLVSAENHVHGTWWFLPFHRAFLYFFEKMLQSAVGDPKLVLPYWDWVNERSIPEAYWGEGNPLFVHRPRPCTDKLSDEEVNMAGGVTRPTFLSCPTFAAFAGHDPLAVCRPMGGGLEIGAHNLIHQWVGGYMIPFGTSPLDPVFWAHHANLDRYWNIWLAHPAATHANPTNARWLKKTFSLLDHRGKPVRISIEDTLSLSCYADESFALLRAEDSRTRVIESAPVTVRSGRLAKALRVADLRVADEPPAKLMLVIEGVELPRDYPVKIRVFLNLPDANMNTPLESPNYVETFSLLAASDETMVVDIGLCPNSKIEKLLRDQQEIDLTLVPVSEPGSSSRSGKVSFTGFSIRPMK
jgi:polyphenol oxidase